MLLTKKPKLRKLGKTLKLTKLQNLEKKAKMKKAILVWIESFLAVLKIVHLGKILKVSCSNSLVPNYCSYRTISLIMGLDENISWLILAPSCIQLPFFGMHRDIPFNCLKAYLSWWAVCILKFWVKEPLILKLEKLLCPIEA